MKFGENLKSLRKNNNLSQEQLAEKVNVSRQSVSKWETGEAYPEMNNILELCKIFKCNINDLVNDSIIDLDSLDEEVKMSVVKFKKEKQKKVKTLSKVIEVLSKIGQIITWIAIPIIACLIIASPIVIKNVDVKEDAIYYKEDKIAFEKEDRKIYVSYKDIKVGDVTPNEYGKIMEILEKNSKGKLILFVEAAFVTLEVTLVLSILILKNLEKLAKNIHNEDTPFLLDNVKYIKKIAYLMIIAILVPNVSGPVYESVMHVDLNIGLEMFDIITILIVFTISYIFEYGYEIQLDSKGKMYGEENE
jgi:transcriptional regulator with XRE-family HTH domain